MYPTPQPRIAGVASPHPDIAIVTSPSWPQSPNYVFVNQVVTFPNLLKKLESHHSVSLDQIRELNQRFLLLGPLVTRGELDDIDDDSDDSDEDEVYAPAPRP
jgi:hypothetical protein